MSLPHVDLSGVRAWRLIPTRVPSGDLLARVADPTDYDLLNALEAQNVVMVWDGRALSL